MANGLYRLCWWLLVGGAAMSEWQPIKTAPKDARILLFRKPRVVVGNWNDDKYAKAPKPFWSHDLIRLWGIRDAREIAPTHWMPLPEPPK